MSDTYSVYIDVLFFVNVMINTVILLSTATVLKIKYSSFRIFIGAVIGAVYACVVFFPEIRFIYSVMFKAAAAMIICVISFAPKTFRQCIIYTAAFYATTAFFGVAALALLYFTDIGIRLGGVISNGVFYFNIPISYLIFSCAVSYAAICIGDRMLKRRSRRRYSVITISKGGRSVSLRALVDTGNMLRDPISGKAVIIADVHAVAPLFEFDVEKYTDADSEFVSLPPGFRLIPFSSVGKSNGLMIAFVPDCVKIDDNVRSDIVTALCGGVLSKNRDYDALLSLEAL